MRYIHDMTSAFNEKDHCRLYMPGHKGKTGYPRDFTEVDVLDDLACPSGAILEANKRVGKMYGYAYATIGTCGSTAFIHAMLLCARGKVLMGRDAHKSAVNAVYLYNIPCSFVDEVTTQSFIDTIKGTDAETLYLTYPNYYGDGIEVDKVIKAARDKGMMIIVDSAHGAHFICHKELPDIPRADMQCVSVHKTLGSLTGGAAVMCKGEYADELRDNVFRIHSTSPSYVIMESIDDAYAFVEDNPDLMDEWIKRCKKAREVLSTKVKVRNNQDLTRIVVSCDGYSGYELFERYKEIGIMGEMADLENVVFLTSPYDLDSIDRLCSIEIEKREGVLHDLAMPIGESCKDIFWVKGKNHKGIPYKLAEGKISYKPVGAYPPGVAAVMPGEIITKEVIEYMERILSYGGKLFSVDDEMIQVVDE